VARVRRTPATASPALLVLVLLQGAGLAPPAGSASPGAPASALAEAAARWERLRVPAGGERATALALDARGRLAVGGERGVALGPLDGRLDRVLARGPVRDLAFAPDGALLAATAEGLFRVEGPARAIAVAVAPGEAARSVHDLAVADGLVAAASDAGVYLSRDTRVWRRASGLPFGPATRVAFEERVVFEERPVPGASAEWVLWAVVEGALWHWRVGETDGARRVPLPRAVEGEGGPVDLVTGVAGADVVVLAVDGIAVLARDAHGAQRWRLQRPVLPPGAAPRRIGAARGVWWIASDAGLLVASSLAGPWRRAGPPAGHVAVASVAAAGSDWIVATAHGLLRASAGALPPPEPPVPAPPRRPVPAGDPPVQAVQRVALRYLALEPERLRALRRGAARRGWLPELEISGGWQRGRDWGEDHDEAFTSGALRRLRDHDRGHDEDFDVGVSLSWELGDVAFADESIDVSREARLVAQLRDDVLDEITQLYFERQRVLARLAAPGGAPADASPTALRLRAAELASGLDAWTGGWFSARAHARRADGASGSASASASASGPASPTEETSP